MFDNVFRTFYFFQDSIVLEGSIRNIRTPFIEGSFMRFYGLVLLILLMLSGCKDAPEHYSPPVVNEIDPHILSLNTDLVGVTHDFKHLLDISYYQALSTAKSDDLVGTWMVIYQIRVYETGETVPKSVRHIIKLATNSDDDQPEIFELTDAQWDAETQHYYASILRETTEDGGHVFSHSYVAMIKLSDSTMDFARITLIENEGGVETVNECAVYQVDFDPNAYFFAAGDCGDGIGIDLSLNFLNQNDPEMKITEYQSGQRFSYTVEVEGLNLTLEDLAYSLDASGLIDDAGISVALESTVSFDLTR